MLTLDALKRFGADTEEGLSRCFNNEAFYLRLVGMIKDEKNFELLEKAIEENDLDAGFEAAHALKGVLGNPSLTPMTEIAVEMTELLRNRTRTDYSGMLSSLLEKKRELDKLLED
ncbi:MAG: Hpt domain-containing protein [Oscillospiraceae bacterium]|nr:Hpt domain-containing protein [Oscillospiraceae bacterium]